jgi:UDP-glucuronate 4-epimerase
MSPLIFLKSVFRKKKIKLFNNGLSLRSYTYIDDVVNYIIKSIRNSVFLKDKKNYHKIYNIGNNKNISTIDFLKLIEKNLNITSRLEKLQNRKADIINTKANINLAIKELGLKPKIDAEVGVRKMCDWFKNSSINFK